MKLRRIIPRAAKAIGGALALSLPLAAPAIADSCADRAATGRADPHPDPARKGQPPRASAPASTGTSAST